MTLFKFLQVQQRLNQSEWVHKKIPATRTLDWTLKVQFLSAAEPATKLQSGSGSNLSSGPDSGSTETQTHHS